MRVNLFNIIGRLHVQILQSIELTSLESCVIMHSYHSVLQSLQPLIGLHWQKGWNQSSLHNVSGTTSCNTMIMSLTDLYSSPLIMWLGQWWPLTYTLFKELQMSTNVANCSYGGCCWKCFSGLLLLTTHWDSTVLQAGAYSTSWAETQRKGYFVIFM